MDGLAGKTAWHLGGRRALLGGSQDPLSWWEGARGPGEPPRHVDASGRTQSPGPLRPRRRGASRPLAPAVGTAAPDSVIAPRPARLGVGLGGRRAGGPQTRAVGEGTYSERQGPLGTNLCS
ncbi:hypothetical protein P7K49_009998 [Saguinus oedipus]|uniref:Uncharacterized protein n=1 Tax=Saguinus oedipus TaxID=9490 RepID=A0ABQ9VLJ6_SAGOE|nr:hypothetical protein P7K49_009998 [Saguinus oedipus]